MLVSNFSSSSKSSLALVFYCVVMISRSQCMEQVRHCTILRAKELQMDRELATRCGFKSYHGDRNYQHITGHFRECKIFHFFVFSKKECQNYDVHILLLHLDTFLTPIVSLHQVCSALYVLISCIMNGVIASNTCTFTPWLPNFFFPSFPVVYIWPYID